MYIIFQYFVIIYFIFLQYLGKTSFCLVVLVSIIPKDDNLE